MQDKEGLGSVEFCVFVEQRIVSSSLSWVTRLELEIQLLCDTSKDGKFWRTQVFFLSCNNYYCLKCIQGFMDFIFLQKLSMKSFFEFRHDDLNHVLFPQETG